MIHGEDQVGGAGRPAALPDTGWYREAPLGIQIEILTPRETQPPSPEAPIPPKSPLSTTQVILGNNLPIVKAVAGAIFLARSAT